MTVISPYIVLVDRNGRLSPQGVRLLEGFVARDAAGGGGWDEARIDALETTVTGHTADIAGLIADVLAAEADIVALTADVAGKQDTILAGSATLTVPNNAIEASATVTAAVIPTSRIVLTLGTMADADENAAELLDVAALAAIPGTGSFVIQAAFLTPTAGAVPVNWSVI